MIYENIIREFNNNSVEYAVCGGIAVIVYGYVRTTTDIDLIINIDKTNIEKCVSILESAGYKCRQPIKHTDIKKADIIDQWIKEKNLVALSFYKDIETVDLIVMPALNRNDLLKNKINIKIKDNLFMPVVSKDDLLRLKQASGRPQDIADIDMLNKR